LVGGVGVPAEAYEKIIPCHKKNPDVGEKTVWYSSEIFIEQEDAATFKQDEEVRIPPHLLPLPRNRA